MIAACPSNESLKSLSLGQLTDEQSDTMLLHVQQCETCQSTLGMIDHSDDTLINQIKSTTSEPIDGLESENGCRVAVTRALAALAMAEQKTNISDSGIKPEIPTSIGEYDIVRPLGHGGMGHVYLGQHTKLGRPVAIKFIAEHRRWDQSMHRRFASEMKLVGGLNHPNIVVAHDAREVGGLAVLVTEFIDGMTVSEILKRQGSLSIEQSCTIAGEACKALSYIDSKGFVHRDIKPSNIMIAKNGAVKVLDLGLARLQSSEDNPGNFTATGQAMGTADYVAPEQVKDGRNVDIRADIYGLGCTLYKLLTGNAPFDGPEYASAFAKMNAHVSERPEPLKQVKPELPKRLAGFVDSMLMKSPSERPQTPDEIQVLLAKFQGQTNLAKLVEESLHLPRRKPSAHIKPKALKDPQTESRTSFLKRHPWLTAVASSLVAIALGAWLGVTITLKKQDGTTATVEIPDGSTAIVDSNGNIEILLAGSEHKLTIPSADVTRQAKSSFVPIAKPKKQLAERYNSDIEVVSSSTFSLDSKSPLFKKVEKGDLIDILLIKDNDRANLPFETLLASRVEVKATSKESTEIQLNIKHLNPILSTRNHNNFAFEFHNPLRANAIDRAKFNGIWRIIMNRHRSQVIPDTANQAVVFTNGEAVFTGDQTFNRLFYSLNNESSAEITFYNKTNPFGKTEVGIYRFLPSERLEISTEIVNSQGGGAQQFQNCWRLERIETPTNKAEEHAFEIWRSVNQFEKLLRFQIAVQEPQDPPAIKGKTLVDEKSGQMFTLIGDPILSNRDIKEIDIEPSFSLPELGKSKSAQARFSLKINVFPEAESRILSATARNINKHLTVTLDGKVLSASHITAPLPGKSSIVLLKDVSLKQANELARAIWPRIEIPSKLALSPSNVRKESLNKLRNITLAMLNYHQTHSHFPSSSMKAAEEGSQPHSWRVAILPFINQNELYRRYNLKEPWNSPHNLKLIEEMPAVFRHPLSAPNSTTSDYVGIADGNCVLGTASVLGTNSAQKGHTLGDITDGAARTVFLVELSTEFPWTKPEDITLDNLSKKRLPKWKFIDEGGICTCFADTTPRFLRRKAITSESMSALYLLEQLLMMNEGATIDIETLDNGYEESNIFDVK